RVGFVMTSIETAAAAAGISADTVTSWRSAEPTTTADLAVDRPKFADFWQLSWQLIESLPRKANRHEAQALVAEPIHRAARDSRDRFLRRHVEAVYATLTQNFTRFVRVPDLVRTAADSFPGLVPSAVQLAAEADTLQGQKDGLEIDQGIFLA